MDPYQNSLPFLTRKMMAFEHASKISLQLSVKADTLGTVEIKGFTREGPFTFRKPVTADVDFATESFRIPDFPVMVTMTSESFSGTANDASVILTLLIDDTPYAVLLQGQLGPFQGLSWPIPPPPTNLQSRGISAEVAGANPAAGEEFSITIPDQEWWILKAVRVRFVAAAVAVSRRPMLVIVRAASDNIEISVPADVTTGQIVFLNWADAGTAQNDATSLRQLAPLPTNLLLPPGATIKSVTTNMEATDNYDPPRVLIEKFYSA